MRIVKGTDSQGGFEPDRFDQLKRILDNIRAGSPEVKAWTARMAAEWVLLNLFKEKRGHFPDGYMNVDSLIKEVNGKGGRQLITNHLHDHFKTITTNYGNTAAHVNEKTGYTKLEEIGPGLAALRRMLLWYLDHLGEGTTTIEDLFPHGYDCKTFSTREPDPVRPTTIRLPRSIAWLQGSSEQCWEFEVLSNGDLVGTAVTIGSAPLIPSATRFAGAAFAISPDGRLAATLEGGEVQLWELNPNTGKPSRWIRRQVLEEPLRNSQVLAIRRKGAKDAWLALDSGGELVLATQFSDHPRLRSLTVPCGSRTPLRAAFLRNSLIYLTNGDDEGGGLLHEFSLLSEEPTDRSAPDGSSVVDVDTADVNGSTVIALLTERNGTAMIVLDVEGTRRSWSDLEGSPSLLGMVRAPTRPLENLCVVLASDGEIKSHYPLRGHTALT